MQTYIGSCKKERIVYPEQKHLHFKKIVNIIANSDSITPQKKKMGDSEIERKIIGLLSTKMGKIRVQL